jgi:predicted Ser/Thr protein kinase
MARDVNLADLSQEKRYILEAWLVDFAKFWTEELLATWVRRLPPKGDPLRYPALVEMIKIDLQRRWQVGQRVPLESYLSSLPELGTPETVTAALIYAEYEARQQLGPPPDLAQLEQRFPRQAAAFRKLVKQATRVGSEVAVPPRQDTAPGKHSTSPGARSRSDAADLPEQFGRYRIIKRLGQGGMGAVYLAQDSQLDRSVALKVPHFTATDGPELLERFQREARAAATLSHPNLCPVYDVGEWQGMHFLTMAYIEGKPLSDYLGTGKLLPERQVAALIRKLALALQEAHARGVIHRDLKPSNIMFNQRKEPVIMDFGLARRIDRRDARLTQIGDVLGTPAYMPPEQVAGQLDRMGPACDIYSLGVILYEMLTGKLPFDGPVMSVLALILTQEPAKPSAHRPELNPQLEEICLKAMAKQPEDRYATMTELAQALADLTRTIGQAARKGQNVLADELSGANVFVDFDSNKTAMPRLDRQRQKRSSPRRLPTWGWATVLGAAALLVVLGIVLLIQTDDGTVRLELSDPNAKVLIKVDGTTIDVAGFDKPYRFKVGEHDLHVSGEGFETIAKTFTVRKGENPVLKVTLVPKEKPRLSDFYDQGVSRKWEPLRDDQGKPIIGRGSCLSSDDLQLVFLRRGDGGGRDATGLFIARRKSLSSPFSSPERLTQTSPNGGESAPCFTNEDRVLYFRSSDADPDRPGPWLWRATRPHRDADFGRGGPAPGVPSHRVGGNRFSPDGNITLLYPVQVKETSPHIVQRRSEKEAFQMEETNLPYWQPGSCSAINPAAIANDGSLVFTWEGDGGMWLCGAKRIAKGTFGKVDRYLVLPDLSRGAGAILATLTHNGRLVISQMNDELIVLRVPEPIAFRIAQLLGY